MIKYKTKYRKGRCRHPEGSVESVFRGVDLTIRALWCAKCGAIKRHDCKWFSPSYDHMKYVGTDGESDFSEYMKRKNS